MAMNARQVMSGLGWSSAASAIGIVAQFSFAAVLARLLDPTAFGLVAMAAIVTRFTGFLAQAGMAQALIQKSHADAADAATALWTSLALGLVLWAITAAAAPWAAYLFAAPSLTDLLPVFGATLPLAATAAIPLAWLRRQARFGAASVAELAGHLLGYGVVGITLALQGHGVWSLVAGAIAQPAVTLLVGLWTSRLPLRGTSRASARRLWHYAGRSSAVGLLEFLSVNIDPVAVARRFGTAELGLYNRATLLTGLPVEQAMAPLQKVLFPALASMQGDRARLGDGFLVMLPAMGLVAVSVSAAVAAAASDVVAVLLGPQWTQTVPLVAVLAHAVPAAFCYVACGLALDSIAALRAKLFLQLGIFALRLVLVLIAVPAGLVAVAWAAVAAEWIRLLLGLKLVERALALPVGASWRAVGAVLAVGAWMYLVVRIAALATADATLPWRVIAEASAAVLALAVAAAALRPPACRYAPLGRFEQLASWQRRLAGQAALHLPAPIR